MVRPLRRLFRRRSAEVRFVPAAEVFSPEATVEALRDVSGWVDRKARVRWAVPQGAQVEVDHRTAETLARKGSVRIVSRRTMLGAG